MREHLRSSGGPFRTIFENHHAVMLLIDPLDGSILGANQSAGQFYGYSVSQLESMTIRQINVLPPDQIDEECRSALREERNHFVFPHRLASGEIRTVEVHSSPIRLGDRTVLFSIVHDITRRKQAEDALRKAEERWSLALQGNTDGVWDWNAQTDEVYYSRRCKEILGYTDDELPSHRTEWRTRIHPDDQQRVGETLADHVHGVTELYACEYRLRHRDGGYRWILDRGKILSRTADGGPLRLAGTHTDITERKEIQQRLESTNRQLEAALSRVTQLEGILPICGFCKKIRGTDHSWHPVEEYIAQRSQAVFSHSLCPECGAWHYPDFFPAVQGT